MGWVVVRREILGGETAEQGDEDGRRNHREPVGFEADALVGRSSLGVFRLLISLRMILQDQLLFPRMRLLLFRRAKRRRV